ncbi:MAG: GDSL-type esterase/lipase family protein [Kiritimatiellae bacterium]|nr:GDSL-type esterase/lipase family protein [Kiritimatiellia bacterium]
MLNKGITIVVLLNLFCGSVLAGQASGTAENKDWGTVVAFGDSITRGYGVPAGSGWVELLPGLLKERRGQTISVFNAGGNANTSAEGMQRLQKDVLAHMPGLVFVEFGGNDAVHSARAVSVDDFEKNLLEINKQVLAKGGKIVLVTFPPVVNERHACRKDSYYAKWGGFDQCIEQYRQRTRDIAKRLECPLFDLDKFLRDLMKADSKDKIIAKDGVHLTAEAHRLVAGAVLDFLEENAKICSQNYPK